MATKTWIGGSGDWNNAADWSSGGVPGANDDVVIGAGAAVSIASGEIEAAGSVSLTDPTASLTVNGVLQNATVRLQGGQLAGTGALDEDTVVGTLTTGALTVEQTVTLDAAPGQPGLVVTAPGGTVSGVGQADLEGGFALIGSPDPSRPVVLQGNSAQFTIFSGLDVIGAVNFFIPGSQVADLGPVNVAPGGNLVVWDFTPATIHIASGTVDDSHSSFPNVSFDDSAGKLVLYAFGSPTITGFRAGDTLDVKGVSVSGALTPTAGILALDQYQITLQGSTAPGATYTAASDGSGGPVVTPTGEPAAAVAYTDETTGATGSHAIDAASGGLAYLQWQYVENQYYGDPDTVVMSASTPDVFLKGGTGTKALTVTSGQNVLDGGSGSSFLTGGSGTDTFFMDVRGDNSVWDTLVNFHAGDAVTVWGWVPGVSTETVDAQAGAAGYQGATLRLANGGFGGQTSSVTFAGLSADQVAHLQTATGTVGGVSYLYLYNPRM